MDRHRIRAAIESLEGRRLLALARPDHIVIVIEQDRASGAIGNPIMPYFNALASSGLNYTNSHGVTHPSEPNTTALYSGSTQGITDNGRNYSFSGANIAKSLFDAGLSFSGFVESLPAAGSQVAQAGNASYPDLYTRNLNAMAQFTDIGLINGTPRANSAVNKPFTTFSSIPTTDYSSLPTVSFIIPNNLHSTHGSNEAYPWAGSADEENNDILRVNADNWLHDNLDGYLQWAKANNSLLIVTQDEERWTGGTAPTVTTVVNGDPRLFVGGTNSTSINHYNVLRTIESMYALPLLGASATASPLSSDSSGRLTPDGTAQPTSSTSLTSSATTSVSGQSVTLTATVTATGGVLSGSVSFRDGTTVLGTASVNSAGVATFTTASLSVGSHSLTGLYSGDATYLGSTSPTLTQTVNKASTTTTITSSAASSTVGQAVNFTARVDAVSPGAGVPTGTVQFKIDGANFGGAVTLVNGVAVSNSTSTLSAGSHSIQAVYSGSSAQLASTSSTLTQSVKALTNDAFANRTLITGTSISLNASNVGATKESGEPKHAGITGGRSVWWTWTAPRSAVVTIDTFGSAFDTLLAVYTGTQVSRLSSVKSNNNASSTLQSSLNFTAIAGRTYQIAVDGYNAASGNIVLHVQVASVVLAAQAAPLTASPELKQKNLISEVRADEVIA